MKIKYRLSFLLGSFFILFFCLPAKAEECATSTGWGYLKINEVYAGSTHDWVEIYNLFDQCVDLTGLKLWDSTATNDKSLVTTTIAHGWSEFSMSNWLNNTTADKVLLKNGEVVLDEFDYGGDGEYENIDENYFWARLPDGTGSWAKTVSGTSGSANILSVLEPTSSTIFVATSTVTTTVLDDATPTTTAASDFSLWQYLRLNEVVSNPENGNEAVEIYNSSTTSINLSGGYICDNRESTSTCKLLNDEISGGQFLWWDLETQSYLNNDADSVRLFGPDNTVIDQVVYGTDRETPDEGESLARSIDGAGEWSITARITSGTGNEIVARAQNNTSGGSGSNEAKATTTSTTVSAASSTSKITASKDIKKEVRIAWKVSVPTQGEPGERLKFSTWLSSDPRGGEVNFRWDFGGNNILSGKEVDYSFATSGIYKVTIFATSTASTTDQYQFNVKVGAGLKWQNTGVKISSLLSDPFDKDSQEYITVINVGSSTINLSGWQLHTVNADKSYIFPEGTKIFPSSTLTFYRLATKLTLNNEGEELELLNSGQEVVDQIKYIKTKKGEVQNFLNIMTSSSVSVKDEIIAKPKTVGSALKSTSRINFSSVSISDVREKAKNTGVITTGIVIAGPKVFGVQYFYIADEANGVQVYNFKKQFSDVKVGDKVSVRGVVTEASGQKRIKTGGVNDIDILSVGNKFEPRAAEVVEVGEDMGGALIQVTGDITEIKTNYMYLDDGENELVVYFKKGAKIDKKKFKEGDKVAVIGVVEVSKGIWQLWPRGDSDIVVVGQAVEVLAKVAPTKENGAGTYLSAALGAATTMFLGFLARARGAILLAMGKKVGLAIARLIRRG